MSSTADGFAGGGGMDEQFFLLSHQHHDGGGSLLFHVPQHSRREKLRFPQEHPPPPATPPLPLLLHHPNSGPHLDSNSANFHQIQQQQQQQQGFSLSLSPAAAGPLGPFTGYAAVLNRSRFLEPARLLLEEVCELGRGGAGVGGCGDLPEALVVGNYREMERAAGENQAGQQWRKTSLISMLDEIYRRYRLYYEQVQAVVASFEKVAGLNTAAPYVSMALKSMSKHFTRIKDVICNHLNHINKALGKEDVSEREFSGFGLIASDAFLQKGKDSGNFGKPPVWRPQRGLPERAVAVLRAWLFEHFLHPYPTDTDKQMLAKQTGLTRNQVANWFINARVRIWKPMVEEIHNLEIRQSHKTMVTDNSQNHGKQASQPSSSSAATSASNQPAQNSCMQRNPPHRSMIPANYELPRIAHQIEEPYNFFFDDFSGHGHSVGVDIGTNSGVSLTLGLHQNNNGVCIPEPLPMNVAHRFGLEECSNAYILGAFEGQDRLFGKDIGGHLLHDFVG